MIKKTLNKSVRMHINIIKVIYGKPTFNIILNGDKSKYFL